MQSGTVITRFPPSPTGLFHIGNARTALFNWLFARHHGGKVLLRFEDTDRARSKSEYEQNIRDGLVWLGLDFDNAEEAPWRQSERTAIYRVHIERLIASGSAYVSRERAKDDPSREVDLVRLRSGGKNVTFHDEIRGDITFDTTELGDLVIARNIGEPLYHLAVVVDDFEMGVTHVIRGEDHISNTARQILIQEAIGAPRPLYAHIPLILAPDRSKLSKRHGATALTDYRDQGYLPQALINYLALLGWSPGDDREVFSPRELIERFGLSRVQKSGAIFNREKLDWLNREHLKLLSDDDFLAAKRIFLPTRERELFEKHPRTARALVPILRERTATFSDVRALAERGELLYFFEDPIFEDASKISWKETPNETTKRHLQYLVAILDAAKEKNDYHEALNTTIFEYALKEGKGAVLWPMRYALSGKDKSPDPITIATIVEREATIRRLKTAITMLAA
ncbi:MAG: glutamate--tRNA ligase [bacterium]|nr:glutamate--tRNA ligase [bacterium]MDZ4285074.1 glutamate--tRNA ligase [Patescibacteria group bacterium]